MLILGVGNILLRDEGIGVRVIQRMHGMELPKYIELFDGGTAGFDLLNTLAGRSKIIVIDAVQLRHEPGAIIRLKPKDILQRGISFASLHQIGLLEALSAAEQLGCAPQQIVIFGVQPKKLSWGLELSPEVASAVPRVIELVLAELGIRGK
ncbi:MAG: HyaD/HybD family hydrogenase maturation endopeptidase [Dehalococcoidales bacterium]|nr:HyaD/HybD family hydrogenase maturation endopeptidase [Dehalococcoidales bacterium]